MATVEVEQVTPVVATENIEVPPPKTVDEEIFAAVPVDYVTGPVTESEAPVEVTTKDVVVEETEKPTEDIEEIKNDEEAAVETPAVVEAETKTEEEVVEEPKKEEEEEEEKKTEETTPVVVVEEEEKKTEVEEEKPTEVAAVVAVPAEVPVEKTDE